jgi:hypothetical protein
VEVLSDGFIKYMDAFKPYLLIGLRNTAEYQVGYTLLSIIHFLGLLDQQFQYLFLSLSIMGI